MKNKSFWIFAVCYLWIFACSGDDNLEIIEGTGTIEAVQVDISSPIVGKITGISFEEGDKVNTGDVLLQIDDSDLLIREKVAAAQFDMAAAQLKLILAGAREEDLRQAQEKEKAAKAAFEKADANFGRIKNLYDNRSSTKSVLDNAKAGLEIAEANHKASQGFLDKLVKGARLEEIEMAQANKSIAEANCEMIRKKISDCIITSPINGIASKKLVETGERIMPNGIAVTITKVDSMWITIFVSDKLIGKVKLGQTAEVKIDSYPNKNFSGVVRYISEEAEFTPKNIQTKEEREKLVFGVKIMIENSEGLLKSGLPADAVIIAQ